jgi:diguanylate cyclase (GGDEF)-like protein
MRLTSNNGCGVGQVTRNTPASPRWALPAIAASCLLVFALDRAIDAAPVQHLYYLPIILAARYYGNRGGIAAALTAIVLYHLANHSLLNHRYQESDIIQIALFLAVGFVTAKLVDDAERLRVLAMTDDLTGLHNLRSFEIQLVSFVRRSRQANLPLSLVVLDVDRLKSLNDKHGHLAGAEAVRAVGHIIGRQIPADAVACRYGGDEFAIALPHCDEGRAEEVALRLCRAVSATAPSLVGREWRAGTLSISAGVACCRFHEGLRAFESADREGEALFRAADEALYQAKERGRNRVHSHRPGAAPGQPR